jgi:type IV secretion system protein VirD4
MKRFLYGLSLFFSQVDALLSRTNELHHARFAKVHELEDLLTDSMPTDSLLLGRSSFSRILHVKSTKTRRELGNCLVVAPTRGGKGLLAVSQLLAWRHSALVLDIKGDLYQQTAGYRATLGKVFVIDPRGYGHRYDPLEGKTDEDDLYTLAKHLLYEPHEGDGKHFTERGTKILTLLWLAALKLNQRTREGEYRLLPFTRHMADLGLNSAAPIIHAISPTIARRLLDGVYNPETDYDERKFLSSSWESFTARLYPLLTEKIVRCFAGSDFTSRDIIASDTPVTVYLCVPESMLLAKAPLLRLILESIIDGMLETFDASGGENCRPVLLLLDEAGTVGIPSLPRFAATAAGRNISVWAAIQDFSQLDDHYGHHKAKSIRNNMGSKIYYRQEDDETAAFIERSLSRRSDYGHSQTLHDGQVVSEGRSEQAVPLLTAREISELDPDAIIAFHSNRKPIRAKRMDWRDHPILVERRHIKAPKLNSLPQLSALPQLEESLPSSLWRREDRWTHSPIDPDAIN